MHATKFNPNEIDLTWDDGKLWAYVEERCYGKSGLPSVWGRGFLDWYWYGGRGEIAKARRKAQNDAAATGRRPKGCDPEGNMTTISVKLTADDHEHVRRGMLAGKITNRSEYFRKLLLEDTTTPANHVRRLVNREIRGADLGGTPMAVAACTVMSELAGLQPVPEADYPGMTLTMYDAALGVARSSMKEILAGTIPMVEEDVKDAGLDPYEGEAWDIYAEVLPKFFRALLGLDKYPTVVVRYRPLDVVDGQHAGAIQGEVRSCRVVYPKGKTDAYLRLRVKVDGTSLTVMAPTAISPKLMLGMTIYAAGTFRVVRERTVLDARQCSVVRREGFEQLYEVADEWGVSERAIYEAVEMLRRRHRSAAPSAAGMFLDYLKLRRGHDGEKELKWDIGNSRTTYTVYEACMRVSPEGEKGWMECVDGWPGVRPSIYRGWG